MVSITVQVKRQIAFLKTLLVGQEAGSSLRSRAVHSGAWIGAGFAVQKVLQLGSNLVLTRLLFPEAFGLMALATVFLVGLQMFSDVGLKPAVIRDPRGDDPVFLNTAWTIQVIRGLLLCVVGAAIAYPVSLIYGQPTLFPLLAALSTTAAIIGFASIGMATAERRLDFRTITIIQLAGQVSSIIMLVTLAYFWRSVWALAVANVISAMLTVAIGYALLPKHHHRLSMDPATTKSLVHFGRWIFVSTVATYLGGEGLKAIQGGLLSPAEFGVLAIAYTIAGIPNDLAVKVSGALGLPVLAETYRSDASRASSVLHALRVRTLVISLGLSIVVIFLSEPLINILYDSRYIEAGKYLAILSLSNAIASINLGYTGAILVLSKGASYFHIVIATSVLRAAGVVVGFEFFGVFGMLYGVAIANLLAIAITGAFIRKMQLLDWRLDIVALLSILLIYIVHRELNLSLY